MQRGAAVVVGVVDALRVAIRDVLEDAAVAQPSRLEMELNVINRKKVITRKKYM